MWLASKDSKGYGQIQSGKRGGKLLRAHRVAYELLIGLIPEGFTLDHFRLNPGFRHAPCLRACVNPAHLEPVTCRENILRGNDLSAIQARQTHCSKGHLLDLFFYNHRQCRRCKVENVKIWRKKNTEKIRVWQRAYDKNRIGHKIGDER